MAEALREAIGHNQQLNGAMLSDWLDKIEDVETELDDVAETRRSLNRRRRDIRKAMGAAGVDLDMFDRMRADRRLTPEELQARDQAYQRYWDWIKNPVGHQAAMDLDAPSAPKYSVAELHAIDGDGFDAGRSGGRADTNPHPAGSEAHQRWLNAWTRGQELAVHEQMGGGEPEAEPAQRRSRGRPRKPAAEANGHDKEEGAAEVTPFGGQEPIEEEAPPPAAA